MKLRERAVRMGLSVSEHGIAEVTDGEAGEVTKCTTEEEVYERLGLAYIEPELRHGEREIAQAEEGELPELLTLDDIRGDLHCHTTLSDGKNSLAEMAEAARERGYAYLAVTDHSATHGFGDDVQPDALRRRIEEVARAQRIAAEGLPRALRLGGEHPSRRLARLRRRPARRARLGRRQRPHLLPDRRGADDRADRRGRVQPAGRLPRAPDRAPDPAPRALRHRRRPDRRGGGRARHDDRDQRQTPPAAT